VLHPTALGTADRNALLNGIPNPLMAKWNPKSALGGAVPMRFRRCARQDAVENALLGDRKAI
jgi:hypothetical protein